MDYSNLTPHQYMELILESTTATAGYERKGLESEPKSFKRFTYSVHYSLTYSETPREGFSQSLSESQLMTIRNIIVSVVGRDVVRDVKTYNDPDYGFVVRFDVDLDAKETLELWLRIAKMFPYTKYGVIIGFRWMGKDNVSEDELVSYIVKIMVIAGLRPLARKPLNIVEELAEERDKR